MSCERTTRGSCVIADKCMKESPILFAIKKDIVSHRFGLEQDRWVIGCVETYAYDLCQEAVNKTEELLVAAKMVKNFLPVYDFIERELIDSVMDLLRAGHKSLDTWSQLICENGHDAVRAYEQGKAEFQMAYEVKWRIKYEVIKKEVEKVQSAQLRCN